MKGHTDQNVKFCHYFNNNQNCIFEELSGCMFGHETAPQCNFFEKCKFRKCQFSHTFHDNIEVNSDVRDEDIESEVVTDEKACTFCDEVVDHSKNNLRTCSNCDFTTKCWAEDNKH